MILNTVTLLALKVGNTQIETPGGLQNITPEKAGPMGQNLIAFAIKFSLTIAIILSLFFLIWGGISWILSGGDKHGVEQARARIMYAIVGLVLTLLSFLIINMIGYFFGVDLLGAPTLTRGEST